MLTCVCVCVCVCACVCVCECVCVCVCVCVCEFEQMCMLIMFVYTSFYICMKFCIEQNQMVDCIYTVYIYFVVAMPVIASHYSWYIYMITFDYILC